MATGTDAPAQERSVPKPVFTDAEAGAREFPSSTSRSYNYFTPAKRRATVYEDVTVDVQPDPARHLLQGWVYGFADGTVGYPEEWTALKSSNWHAFLDPNEEWEQTIYRNNANVVRQISQNLANAKAARAFDGWNSGWVGVVERHVGAWAHVEHGIGMHVYLPAQRDAPTNMINNAISVASAHKLRFGQDLILYNLDLSESIEGFNGSAHSEAWNTDPIWQGVRENVERLTAVRDWVSGQEQYAKGWIECFHAYMGLAPAETHWPLDKFMKYSEEDFVKDVFEDGGADVAICQSTYLKEWYTTGFNTVDKNAVLAEKYPGKVIVNGRFDPREGEAGLKQLEEDAKKYNLQGVKLYTAEWYKGSRGWRLDDEMCKPFYEKCKEVGIKHVHVHKGPTIWPLDKDAFDPRDVDQAATDNPELNFIVEHTGIPRIEDFCFMAVQEPNVYAGIAVVVGGLMHARPRFFAKVMGELLFWVGEDKMLFGSDYAIWEPKWQIDGLLDWNYPDDPAYSDYPNVTDVTKRKILGLNAAALYGIEVPAELQLPADAGTPAAKEAAVGVESA